MSGPKIVTYTMKAFSGKLSALMRLQNQLKNQFKLLKNASIIDTTLNVKFDYKDQLVMLQSKIEKATSQIIFDYETFGQVTYDIIEGIIGQRKAEILELIKQTESLTADYEDKLRDCETYKDYQKYLEKSKKSFETFKNEISHIVVESLKEHDIIQHDSAKTKISQINLEIDEQVFQWGFAGSSQTVMNNIMYHVAEQENEIKNIISENLDILLNSGICKAVKSDIFMLNPVISEEVKMLSAKIEQLIKHFDDTSVRNNYLQRLNTLKQSNSMWDIFFYKELHDCILKDENTGKFKKMISDSLSLLNGFESHSSVDSEKVFLQQKGIKLISSSEINENDWLKFRTGLKAFYANNRRAIEEEELRISEQMFAKAQIIHNLERKGYVVMEDLEVIDFEKENSFYLKIPAQENILNVIFRDDGSFRYVFQIPEDKNILSVAQQQQKLHEMQKTCDDFYQVLSELSQMGVKLKIQSDKPLEMSSVITVPEAMAKKLEKQKTITRKEQIKKLYLE